MLDSQRIVINKHFAVTEVNYLSIMRTCGEWKLDDWKGPVPHFFRREGRPNSLFCGVRLQVP